MSSEPREGTVTIGFPSRADGVEQAEIVLNPGGGLRTRVTIRLDLTDFARALRGVCSQPCTFTIMGEFPDSELLASPAPTCGLCGDLSGRCKCRL